MSDKRNTKFVEGWLSGLRRSPGKRVYVYSVSGVQIPILPPLFKTLAEMLGFSRFRAPIFT
ncbi:hypothetical protein VCRA2123O444_150058 [Vibrio crassostreae]|nr:hypothetical protein VCRA2119O431_150058 [Vibrio crassostreae]CAK1767851.1 hypothetical protein VCRA2114O422_150058 [Vibrio crassostreae]CAK1770406.1 hypothetical protein VCRA2113O409_150058 [Vibrio crassostreae]CAK1777316.1 hypothetical protein VCRA2114O421_150051 [Vibrio crassostreae]CAK1779184.1 hypothetical protein VCRA2113O418_150052 [Vibrio crassostreae]